ncbi:MAG: hypothetical protein ACI8T1_004080 [Verrucomicrobiales bacterium]
MEILEAACLQLAVAEIQRLQIDQIFQGLDTCQFFAVLEIDLYQGCELAERLKIRQQFAGPEIENLQVLQSL